MTGEPGFSIAIHVRFRDLDAMGHVNNAVMFTCFEERRTEFFLLRKQLSAHLRR